MRLADDGETITTLDGVERTLTARRPAHLRRRARAAGDRRDHGRLHVGGVRRHHRDPARVGVLRAHGHRPQLEAAQAAQRVERTLRAWHRPRGRRRQRRAGDGAARRRGRGAGRARRASTSTRRRSSGPRIRLRTSRVERGARHRPRRRGRVGRAGAPRHRARRRRRRARRRHRGRDRRRRSAPTSTARSTWSRRWRARIGFDRIGRTLPDTHGQVGMLTLRQQERRAVADALVGIGLSEAITLSLVAPGRPRARRRSRSTGSCAPPTRCAPRSRCCAPRCCPGCCGRSPATGRRASPTSRCSSWAGCSSSRSTVAAPATTRCPTSPSTSRWRVAGTRPPSPGRGRPRRSTCTTRVDAVARRARRARHRTTSCSSPRRSPATAPGAPRRVLVDGDDAGAVGEVAPDACSTRSASTRRWSPPSSCSTRCSTPPGATARSARRRASPRRRIDLAFVVDDTVPAADVVRTLRDAVGDAARGRAPVRRVPVRDASVPGRRSLAFALRFRAPDRTLTDAEVGDAAPAGHRRGRGRPRRRAPRA